MLQINCADPATARRKCTLRP